MWRAQLVVPTRILFLDSHGVFDLEKWPHLSDKGRELVEEACDKSRKLKRKEKGKWSTSRRCFLIVCMEGVADEVQNFVEKKLQEIGVPIEEGILDLGGLAGQWQESMATMKKESASEIKVLQLNANHLRESATQDVIDALDKLPSLTCLDLAYNSFKHGIPKEISSLAKQRDIKIKDQ